MYNFIDLVIAAKKATIPAPDLRAVTLAQWILESSYGTSELAKNYGNYAGIKYRDKLGKYAIPVTFKSQNEKEIYCAFKSYTHFIEGYWQFLTDQTNKSWVKFSKDPIGFINFLQMSGFLQGQEHAAKVLTLLPMAEKLLGMLDEANNQRAQAA